MKYINFSVLQKPIGLFCISLLIAGCSYNLNNGKTRFTPLGSGPHEMIETIVKDVKECAIESDNTCETQTAHDDYEASKIKAMTNEEFDQHVENQKEKVKQTD